MGLRHSLKKNMFLKGDSVKNVFFNKNMVLNQKNQLFNKTTSINLSNNYCIKYVYNETIVNTTNSKKNNVNFNEYYYNNNIPIFKPLAANVFANTFVNNRICVIS